MEMASNFFNPGPFMPHGGCYLWTQSLIALHSLSDATIGLSYYSIPLALLYFARLRKDLDWRFKGVFVCFATFVLACGTTHLMEIWNIWHANYWLAGFIKAFTALVSMFTAVLIVKLIPQALTLPSTADLRKAHGELEIRVRERTAELQDSELKFRSLFNNAEVGMFRSRIDGSAFLDINAKYLSILGRTRDEVIGKPSNNFWADLKEREKMIRLLKTKGQIDGFECRLLKKTGEVIYCLTSLKSYPEAGILEGSITDITERKRAEEEMRWKTAFFEALVNSSQDGILVVDNQNRKIIQNQRMTDLWKIPPEIAGNPDDQLQYEFAREQSRNPEEFDEKNRRLAANADVHARDEIELKDGTVLERQTALVLGRHGEKYGRLWSFRDITGSRLIEKSLTRLGTAVEQAAEVIVITDTNGTILYVNPAFEKSSGYTRTEAVGQNPRFLKSGKQDDEFYRQMWATLTRGESWSGHMINKRKDGAIYEEEATISPVRDANGLVVNYVAVKRDVTHEVQLEAQLRQAQKMEAIGRLAGGVAHDFNNILAIISMQASLLKSGGGLSPHQARLADEIGNTVDRASGLTRQLLLFSRKESLQLHDLDLNQVTNDLTKMLRRLLGEDIGLQLKLAEQPMFVHADQGMMDQVLMNLAVNARDAMPNGGRLIIETSGVAFNDDTAFLPATARPGSFVCLSVSDNGCGIPADILPRIFEPFFTTKDVGKGTGLGLATVFGIVQQHKGWINVYSEVGQGTTFRIYLPRLTNMTGRKIAEKTLAAVPTGQETILLVEDEPALRDLIKKTLTQLGYHILEAPSGIKALEIWQAHRAEIRLLLTDIVMPDAMSGIDLAQRLLQNNPKLKIIYMSGYSAEVASKDVFMEEGVNFLTKPFQMHMLAQILRDRLDKPAGSEHNLGD